MREQLELRNIPSFLPLYKTVAHWKDRRVHLHLPLFPGYVFVRISLLDRLPVLQIPSVVRLVGFNGRPSPLSDEEIEGLKNGLAGDVRAEPYPFLIVGRRVTIKAGPLEGHQGILMRRKGSLRVVLSLELIQRSIIVDVDIADVQPLTGTQFSFQGSKGEYL